MDEIAIGFRGSVPQTHQSARLSANRVLSHFFARSFPLCFCVQYCGHFFDFERISMTFKFVSTYL